MDTTNILPIIVQGIVGLIVYILVAWAKSHFDRLFMMVSGDERSLIGTVNFFFFDVAENTHSLGITIKDFVNNSAIKKVNDLIDTLSFSLKALSENMGIHTQKVIDAVFSKKEDERSWRVGGALIQLVFLILFIYADISQGYNSLTGSKVFESLVIPPFFESLAIPILVASVGSIAALSLVLFDLYGMTHFVPWEWLWGAFEKRYGAEALSKFRKILITIVIITMIVAPILALMISMGRITSFVTVSASMQSFIDLMVGLSQWLIMLPMLITTVFLIWGITSLLLVYTLIVNLLRAFPLLLTLLLRLLEVILNVIGFILAVFIVIIAFIVEKIFSIVSSLIKLIRILIEVVYIIINLLVSPARKILKVED